MPLPHALLNEPRELPLSPLLDTHHHFDFLHGSELRAEFLKALTEHDVRIVAQTLTPSSFMELMSQVPELAAHGVPHPLWSVGFHPWYIQGEEHAEAELEIFTHALEQTRFVGEIGLDFAPGRLEACPTEAQEWVLRRMLGKVIEAAGQSNAAEPYVLSIHAVRSADRVLDLLEEMRITDHNVAPVFHWFSGTSDELTRLVRLGGYVSVNPRMFESKRGRAYVKQVPAESLLLETDLPNGSVCIPADGDPATHARVQAEDHWNTLSGVLSGMNELWDVDLVPMLEQTQTGLYGPLQTRTPHA